VIAEFWSASAALVKPLASIAGSEANPPDSACCRTIWQTVRVQHVEAQSQDFGRRFAASREIFLVRLEGRKLGDDRRIVSGEIHEDMDELAAVSKEHSKPVPGSALAEKRG